MLETLKRNHFIRALYRVPGLVSAYHWLLTICSAPLYGFPSRRVKVIGVTGTKGKTTTAEILAAILEQSGKKTALLSSIKIKVGENEQKNRLGNSMPGRGFIQRFLRRALRARCTHAVIEVTSEGIVKHRHRFIHWAVAAITNIAPEHIESHGSFEKYRDAKLAFLKYAARGGAPVFVNAEDERSKYYLEQLGDRTKTYRAADLPSGLSKIWTVLPGEFNKQNVAAAAAAARELGVGDEDIRTALENFKGVSGRADFVQREPFAVVVDYAHTPESIEAICGTLREQIANRKSQIAGTLSDLRFAPSRRLICVFGATGGGRDKWKRPVMGEKAAMYCDDIILTDDDPYDEDPNQILSEIKSGISNTQFPISNVTEIVNRKRAIREAISRARAGDTVVIMGKGTEPFLHLAGGQKIEWNDKEVALEALHKVSSE